jgi:hypothetical protein
LLFFLSCFGLRKQPILVISEGPEKDLSVQLIINRKNGNLFLVDGNKFCKLSNDEEEQVLKLISSIEKKDQRYHSQWVSDYMTQIELNTITIKYVGDSMADDGTFMSKISRQSVSKPIVNLYDLCFEISKRCRMDKKLDR